MCKKCGGWSCNNCYKNYSEIDWDTCQSCKGDICWKCWIERDNLCFECFNKKNPVFINYDKIQKYIDYCNYLNDDAQKNLSNSLYSFCSVCVLNKKQVQHKIEHLIEKIDVNLIKLEDLWEIHINTNDNDSDNDDDKDMFHYIRNNNDENLSSWKKYVIKAYSKNNSDMKFNEVVNIIIQIVELIDDEISDLINIYDENEEETLCCNSRVVEVSDVLENDGSMIPDLISLILSYHPFDHINND
jgi:hypothetical protein